MQTNEKNPYDQGEQLTMISVKLPDGGWIVWNWNAAEWNHMDELPCPVAKEPEDANGN